MKGTRIIKPDPELVFNEYADSPWLMAEGCFSLRRAHKAVSVTGLWPTTIDRENILLSWVYYPQTSLRVAPSRISWWRIIWKEKQEAL